MPLPLLHLATTLAIAAYFVWRSRAAPRPEASAWAWAWVANVAALALAIALPGLDSTAFVVTSACYLFAQAQFVVLLVAGASRLAHERPRPVPHGRFGAVLGMLSVLGGLLVGTLDRVGLLQSVVLGAFFYAGAITVARAKAPAWRWLALGFVARALLAALETSAYAFRTWHPDASIPGWLAAFMACHEAFDAVAEGLIALGCAFALRARDGTKGPEVIDRP
jgi:hypothetical protein